MQQALEQLRQVIAAPTAKGLLAAAGMLWAALVNGATDGFLISFGAVVVTYTLNGALGTWQAVVFDEFDKAKLKGWITRFIVYTSLSWLAFVAGATAGMALDSLGVNGVAAAYLMATGVNLAIAGTEGLSMLDHANRLMGGALERMPFMGPLRKMLEQMRDWTPTRKPQAAPNGGP